jgi:hypothetical protein
VQIPDYKYQRPARAASAARCRWPSYPVRERESRILFIVNGQDDNNNGWVDEGRDGVENNFAFEQGEQPHGHHG